MGAHNDYAGAMTGRLIGSVVGAVLFIGCGGGGTGDGDATGGSGRPDGTAVAEQLAQAIRENENGSTLVHATCIARTDSEFRCSGEYQASRESVEQEMGSIDTSNFGEADWQVLIEQRGGPVTYDVVIDLEDGSFIYNPV
jgi:hypothetical protein